MEIFKEQQYNFEEDESIIFYSFDELQSIDDIINVLKDFQNTYGNISSIKCKKYLEKEVYKKFTNVDDLKNINLNEINVFDIDVMNNNVSISINIALKSIIIYNYVNKYINDDNNIVYFRFKDEIVKYDKNIGYFYKYYIDEKKWYRSIYLFNMFNEYPNEFELLKDNQDMKLIK